MKRRTLLQGLAATAAGLSVSTTGFRLPLVHAADYRGKLFVFVQADGGWDPTSFCDPKSNTPGEPVINHWAQHDDVRQAGNIPLRPLRQQRGVLREVPPADAGHQRSGCTDELATPSVSCTTGAGATPRAIRRRPRCSPRTTRRSCR